MLGISNLRKLQDESMEELIDFIQGNPDPRELKRALAVQMVMKNYTHSQVREILQVSVGFVNKWKAAFLEKGVARLILKHQGSRMISYSSATSSIDRLAQAEKLLTFDGVKRIHRRQFRSGVKVKPKLL